MEEKSIFDQPNRPFNSQQPLQNSTAVLVLGILSIVICGVGVVLGIIALVLANKDFKTYNASPDLFTNGSYSNLKAGRTCAVIGLILNGLLVIFYAVVFAVAFSSMSNAWR